MRQVVWFGSVVTTDPRQHTCTFTRALSSLTAIVTTQGAFGTRPPDSSISWDRTLMAGFVLVKRPTLSDQELEEVESVANPMKDTRSRKKTNWPRKDEKDEVWTKGSSYI